MKTLMKITVAMILANTITSYSSIAQSNDSTKIKSNDIKSYNSKFGFNSEEPLVCTLTGAEQAERKELLQKEIFSQVKKFEEIQMGYVFLFKYDEIFLMKMTDYVIAENNCCPFLTFNIKLHSNDDVRLEITGSSIQAKEMIKMALIDKI